MYCDTSNKQTSCAYLTVGQYRGGHLLWSSIITYSQAIVKNST